MTLKTVLKDGAKHRARSGWVLLVSISLTACTTISSPHDEAASALQAVAPLLIDSERVLTSTPDGLAMVISGSRL
jgi:hypothetical protein